LNGCASSTPPTSNFPLVFFAMTAILVIREELFGERHARHPVPALVIVLTDASEFFRALLAHSAPA